VEHVYEGQTLGKFFTEWITQGQIADQYLAPGRTTGKVTCIWVHEWITRVDSTNFPWTNPIDPNQGWSFAQTLHTELGNNYHKDRLAILASRINRKKENVRASRYVCFDHKLNSLGFRIAQLIQLGQIQENEC
jgi:chitinase